MTYDIPSSHPNAKQIEYYVDASGCWICTSHKQFPNGYYAICRNGIPDYIHRVIWAYYNRTIVPDGLCVLHKCDKPSCINPEHLFIGTHQDNMDDKVRKGRQQKGEEIHNARLTTPDIVVIRARVRAGETQKNIADDYGVDRITINDVVNGRTWVGVGI